MPASIDRCAYGVVAKAIARAGISPRTDRRDGLVALLSRLLRRARGARQLTVCPEVERRAWVRDAANGRSTRPPCARTIQRWLQQLSALGLVKLVRHASANTVVLLFRLPAASAHPETEQLSAPTFYEESEAPSELRLSAVEGPTGAALAPQSAPATPTPLADTSSAPSRAGAVRHQQPASPEALQRLREATRAMVRAAAAASPWRRREARQRAEREVETQLAFHLAVAGMPEHRQRFWRSSPPPPSPARSGPGAGDGAAWLGSA